MLSSLAAAIVTWPFSYVIISGTSGTTHDGIVVASTLSIATVVNGVIDKLWR